MRDDERRRRGCRRRGGVDRETSSRLSDEVKFKDIIAALRNKRYSRLFQYGERYHRTTSVHQM